MKFESVEIELTPSRGRLEISSNFIRNERKKTVVTKGLSFHPSYIQLVWQN